MSKAARAIYNPTTIEDRMQPARIAELLEPFLGPANDQRPKTEDLISNISTYIDILLRWNARINLTAIRDPDEIVTRHFGESLFAARCLFPGRAHVGTASLGCPAEQSSAADASTKETSGRAALQRREEAQPGTGALAPEGFSDNPHPATSDQRSLADVGSGAGFPGLPIKLWHPALSVTLIESNHKKVAFLREVTRALRLTDVNIQNARAETLPQSSFDVVTLRAVERFDTILPVAASLVAPAGRLALLIGADQLKQARAVLTTHTLSSPIPIPLSRTRILLTAVRQSDSRTQPNQDSHQVG